MRLIDADALIKSLKKDWPQTSKIKWAQIVAKCAPTIDIVFLCDGTACKGECHKQCFHTSDIKHARNFYKEGEVWTEMLEI